MLVGVLFLSLLCYALLCVHSRLAIILAKEATEEAESIEETGDITSMIGIRKGVHVC